VIFALYYHLEHSIRVREVMSSRPNIGHATHCVIGPYYFYVDASHQSGGTRLVGLKSVWLTYSSVPAHNASLSRYLQT